MKENIFFLDAEKLISKLFIFNTNKFAIQLFELCYNTPEIFLFLSLMILSLQYSLQVVNLHLYKSATEITFHYCQKVINRLWVTLFLTIINPIPWLTIKLLHSGFSISSPQITALKIVIILISIFILQSSLFYIYIEKLTGGDFFVFYGYLVSFLLIFLQINDFFVLFLMFELISLLLYVLIAYHRKQITIQRTNGKLFNKYSSLLQKLNIKNKLTILNIQASFTYFLLNILITAIFLFGLSIIFFLFNTSNFFLLCYLPVEIHFFFFYPKLFKLACLSLLFVFFSKSAIVPCHWWISAVFEGCSLITLMFLAIPLKIVFFYLFLKLLLLFFNSYIIKLSFILLIVALLSMIVGSLGLLTQLKIKKFWAYSTVNHMGYSSSALSSNTFLGLRAFFLYFVAYLIMNLSFFLILVSCINENLLKRIQYLNQLAILGLWPTNLTALSFGSLLASLIGIPPFLGFWGKFLVISSTLITFSSSILIIIILIIIITSMITAAGYLKLWKIVFIENIYQSNIGSLMPIPIFNSLLLILLNSSSLFLSILFYFNHFLYFIIDNFLYKIIFN